jgi:hypothetical protein
VIERLRRIDEANTMRNTALAASLALTAMMVGLAPAANAACSTQTLLTPNIGAIGSRLFSISGLAANDLWSVGTHNNTLYGVRGMILHYDGTAWTVVDKPTMPMESVTEINPNDVWALAGAGALQLEHWNGSSWTVVQVAPPDRRDTAVLNGVSGNPAQLNELWTVGSEGPRGLAYDFAFAEKWDGHGWSKFKPPGGINTGELLSVSETNDGRAWAVGDEVDPNLMSSAVIDHWNGTQWIRVPAAELGGSLTSVAAIADNDVWAAGFGNSAPIVEHWDGTRWSKVPFQIPGSVYYDFQAIAVASRTDAWLSGIQGPFNSSNASLSLLEHWDGRSWKLVSAPSGDLGNYLYGVVDVGGTATIVGSSYNNDPAHFRAEGTLSFQAHC